jgi:hypothetical protein
VEVVEMAVYETSQERDEERLEVGWAAEVVQLGLEASMKLKEWQAWRLEASMKLKE